MENVARRFVCYIFFPIGWSNISLGVTIDFKAPNIEIHLPFCFLKLGYCMHQKFTEEELSKKRHWGYESKIEIL